MEKLNRGDKIYLDEINNSGESIVNTYLSCRDGIVEVYEYNDGGGYGAKTRLFLCKNSKHESVCIVRQTWNGVLHVWDEEEMVFDYDSFTFLEGLLSGNKNVIGGTYSLVRDY